MIQLRLRGGNTCMQRNTITFNGESDFNARSEFRTTFFLTKNIYISLLRCLTEYIQINHFVIPYFHHDSHNVRHRGHGLEEHSQLRNFYRHTIIIIAIFSNDKTRTSFPRKTIPSKNVQTSIQAEIIAPRGALSDAATDTDKFT